MEKLAILAPAKINLYLNVCGRRPDGYHDIESVMQTVSLFDRLELTKNEADDTASITLFCKHPKVPTDKKNLVYRAAEAFFAEAGIRHYNVTIRLEKHIPVEAGLGGGSSDAAATLIALDRLYKTTMSSKTLCAIGARLGADVPFCVLRGTAYATGIGEILSVAPPMPDCAFVIAIPKGSRVSTAEAYRKIDSTPANDAVSFNTFCKAIADCDLTLTANMLYNRFETVTDAESGVQSLLFALSTNGALGARMSGSGPSVFAIFPDVATARAAKDALPDSVESFVCIPARENYPYIEG